MHKVSHEDSLAEGQVPGKYPRLAQGPGEQVSYALISTLKLAQTSPLASPALSDPQPLPHYHHHLNLDR